MGQLTAGSRARLPARWRQQRSGEESRSVTTSADVARIDTGAGFTAAAPRRSRLSARQTAILSALLIVILLALVVPPFLFLVQGSFTIAGPTPSTSTWGLGNFEAV